MYVCICNAITEKDIEDLIAIDPERFRAPANILSYHKATFKCNMCVKEFYAEIEKYYEQKDSS